MPTSMAPSSNVWPQTPQILFLENICKNQTLGIIIESAIHFAHVNWNLLHKHVCSQW